MAALGRAASPEAEGWSPGAAPVAVVMIALNEGHHMAAVLDNLAGWAQEVFLLDSYSTDETIDLALARGVHVVQRRFRGFGDQWRHALEHLPISAPWTMKLDPDERLSDEVKAAIIQAVQAPDVEGLAVELALCFMGRPLPSRLVMTRLWRTGRARFSDVTVNEHPVVNGKIVRVGGLVHHHDSPDLDHWLAKQNAYTTAEAIRVAQGQDLAVAPRLLGSSLERRMWLKRHFMQVPGRYAIIFLYHLLWLGAWRAGQVGWMWARLRTEVYRIWEYKLAEIRLTGRLPLKRPKGPGAPDPRVPQHD